MNLFIKIFCRFIYTFYFCAIKRTFFETLFYLHPFQTFSSNSIKRMCLCINKWWYHLPTIHTNKITIYARTPPRESFILFTQNIIFAKF